MSDLREVGSRDNPGKELREWRVVQLRYVDAWDETSIALEVGLSLSHVQAILKQAREEARGRMRELLPDRAVAWQIRIENLYKKFYEKFQSEGLPYDQWLETGKVLLATAALSAKIDGQLATTLNKGQQWLTTDESSLTDQQVVEMAKVHGIRIPAVPSQLALGAGSPPATTPSS